MAVKNNYGIKPSSDTILTQDIGQRKENMSRCKMRDDEFKSDHTKSFWIANK